MHVVEPPWNQANLDQIIGRAIRHRSHALLPEDQRNVRIFMWTSTKTPEQIAAEKAAKRYLIDDTADQRISKIIARKLFCNRQFLEIFRCNSINVLPYLTVQDVPNSIRRSADSRAMFEIMGQQLNGIRTIHQGTQAEVTKLDVDILNDVGLSNWKKPGFVEEYYTFGQLWYSTQSNEIRELSKLFVARGWPNVVGTLDEPVFVAPEAVVGLPDVPAEVPAVAEAAEAAAVIAEAAEEAAAQAAVVPPPLPQEEIINLISQQE